MNEARIKALQRRIEMVLARGTVEAVQDDGQMQSVDLALMHDERATKLERFQQYGLSSHPHAGAESVTVFLQGNRDHGVVIAVDDRRYRMTSMAPGEVAVYDDQDQCVHLKRDQIHVKSPTRVVVECDDIRLGSEGASRRVALEGSTDTMGHALTGDLSTKIYGE